MKCMILETEARLAEDRFGRLFLVVDVVGDAVEKQSVSTMIYVWVARSIVLPPPGAGDLSASQHHVSHGIGRPEQKRILCEADVGARYGALLVDIV